MIKPDHLLKYIITPVNNYLGMWSKAADRLVLGTALTEGIINGETWLHQNGGPAVGPWQMEPNTYNDIWANWLSFNTDVRDKVKALMSAAPVDGVEQMRGNLFFAAAMTRILYRRIKVALPDVNDLEGLALYWKKYYNTPLGKGVPDVFVKKLIAAGVSQV